MNCFTLRIIIILMETIKDLYISALGRVLSGWTAGGGAEYALGYGWSVKGEYLYVDFGVPPHASPLGRDAPSDLPRTPPSTTCATMSSAPA